MFEYNKVNRSTISSCKLVISLFCWLMILELSSTDDKLPWEQWSWSQPQGPIEKFFRRRNDLPYKAPNFECKCPPFKECAIDYKINEAAAEFLNMRGVMKQDELQTFKEDVKEIEGTTKKAKEILAENARQEKILRRQMPEERHNKGCCCPPRSLMMPSFITNQKFDDFVDSFDKKKMGDVTITNT